MLTNYAMYDFFQNIKVNSFGKMQSNDLDQMYRYAIPFIILNITKGSFLS